MKKLISTTLIAGIFTTLPVLANETVQDNLILEANLLMKQSIVKMNKRLSTQLERDIEVGANVWGIPTVHGFYSQTLIAKSKVIIKENTASAE